MNSALTIKTAEETVAGSLHRQLHAAIAAANRDPSYSAELRVILLTADLAEIERIQSAPRISDTLPPSPACPTIPAPAENDTVFDDIEDGSSAPKECFECDGTGRGACLVPASWEFPGEYEDCRVCGGNGVI